MNQELGIKNNTKIKTFTDLLAWQEGHKLVLMVYKITTNFPKTELFALVDQLRRAAVSITSNIAEGFSRQSYSEKVHFYSIAQGSVTEVQNQLLIARDIGYIKTEDFNKLAEQFINTHKVINGLIKKSKTIRDS
ncbi:MAG: four helix bundle protein [Candidatus Kerfeldbacteria bacterium]|nr:four helix bundle protein [Candidatus Kerfeldbacteria bacterium]